MPNVARLNMLCSGALFVEDLAPVLIWEVGRAKRCLGQEETGIFSAEDSAEWHFPPRRFH